MFVPEQVPKCVCFLSVKAQGQLGEYDHFIGTAFLVGFSDQSGDYDYLVTARHVIQEAKRLGDCQFFVRLNTKGGSAEVIAIPDEWVYPENEAVDAAVLSFDSTLSELNEQEIDHAAITVEMLMTDGLIRDLGIGLGDGLLVVGLFRYRWGHRRSIPIARTGNIAAMPDEPFIEESGEVYNAYLTELRSIGGLSGSPVFVFKLVQADANEIAERQKKGLRLPPLPKEKMYLLGLVRGHWDLEPQGAVQDIAVVDEDGEIEYLNTGIAQVTPIQEVLALINGERLVRLRAETKAKG